MPQQFLVQALGVDVARVPEMLQHRDVAVEQLQHEIVGALQPAAGGRIGGVAGEFLELVVHPADDPVDPAVDDRMRGAGQERRRELLVEHDGAVAHLEDARDGKADIAGLGGLAQLEGQAGIGDVDLLLDAKRRGGIDQRLGRRHEAAGALGLGIVDLAGVRAPRRAA